jgi:hypothetical protein
VSACRRVGVSANGRMAEWTYGRIGVWANGGEPLWILPESRRYLSWRVQDRKLC